MHRFRLSLILTAICLVAAVPAFAGHAWENYHWKNSGTELNIPIHDTLSDDWRNWEYYLDVADGDWDQSPIFANTVYWDQPLSNPKRCVSATGKIEVCNAAYGRTGWLGVAGIWVSGGHITKGYTKVNDTYFDTATYNTPAWRMFVMCQEIGHDFGLGHVNETFDDPNTGSCMDYTNDPDGGSGGASETDPSNEHPNAHDYEQLEIQHHWGTSDALGMISTMAADATRPRTIEEIYAGASQWGAPVKFDKQGRPTTFRLVVPNHGGGENDMIITHVLWAPIDPFEHEIERPDVRQ